MAALRLSELLTFDFGKLSPRAASDALSLIRAAKLHKPAVVLELGDSALSYHSSSTRHHWDIIEQICRAAAECGEHEISNSFIRRVMTRFPHSVRAFVLHGINMETKGDLEGAMTNYIEVVSKEAMAPQIYKRQIAVLKTELRTSEAIALLNYYLSIYSNDPDAWAELCALCLSTGRLSHALFAANELLVHDNGNFAYHILAADVLMTCGSSKNTILARKHYAASLNARKSMNLRALYGLWLSCSISLEEELDDKERAQSEKLLDLAKAGIKTLYSSLHSMSGKSSSAHVETVLTTSIFPKTDLE